MVARERTFSTPEEHCSFNFLFQATLLQQHCRSSFVCCVVLRCMSQPLPALTIYTFSMAGSCKSVLPRRGLVVA